MRTLIKLTPITIILLLASCSGTTPGKFFGELADREKQQRFAIGYVYDRELNLVVLGAEPSVKRYLLPGPGFYAATIGVGGEVYGVSRGEGGDFSALQQNGNVMWKRRGLFADEIPALSTDGKALAFRGRDSDSKSIGLLIVDDAGKRVALVSSIGKSPSWSPDGSRLLYEESGDVFIYEVRSQRSTKICRGSDPRWSPDGSSMVLRLNDGKFWLADARGKYNVALLDSKGLITPLYWSPDSQYLMFVKKGSFLGALGCFDAAADLMVLRVRDVLTQRVRQFCQSYPYEEFRWVYVPSNPSL